MRFALVILLAVSGACGGGAADAIRERDLADARTALETNLAAIRRHDAEAYLAHYLDSPDLVIASADSLRRGFFVFAEARRADPLWPETLLAGDPTLVWLAPGVVWAGFQYTAVIGGDTTWGVSERVFVKTGLGWKIAITGSMER